MSLRVGARRGIKNRGVKKRSVSRTLLVALLTGELIAACGSSDLNSNKNDSLGGGGESGAGGMSNGGSDTGGRSGASGASTGGTGSSGAGGANTGGSSTGGVASDDGGAGASACEAYCGSSTSSCECLDEIVSWRDVGGLVAWVDRSEVAPCATYSHRSDPVYTDPPSLECSQELLPCAGDVFDAADIAAALSNSDVVAARTAAPVLYGIDSRPVDGTVLEIVIGADVIEVGGDCGSTTNCAAIPPGIAALAELLRALDAQELARSTCALVFSVP